MASSITLAKIVKLRKFIVKKIREKLAFLFLILSAASYARADVPCAGSNISPSWAAFIGVLSSPSAGRGVDFAVGVYLTGPIQATATRTANTIKIVVYGPPEEGIPPPIRCVPASLPPMAAGKYVVNLYSITDQVSAPEVFITSATLDVLGEEAPVRTLSSSALLLLYLTLTFAAWFIFKKRERFGEKAAKRSVPRRDAYETESRSA